MDESMAPMSVPNVTDTVTSHLLTGARVAAGAIERDRFVRAVAAAI
jgi:hypothetical protein